MEIKRIGAVGLKALSRQIDRDHSGKGQEVQMKLLCLEVSQLKSMHLGDNLPSTLKFTVSQKTQMEVVMTPISSNQFHKFLVVANQFHPHWIDHTLSIM